MPLRNSIKTPMDASINWESKQVRTWSSLEKAMAASMHLPSLKKLKNKNKTTKDSLLASRESLLATDSPTPTTSSVKLENMLITWASSITKRDQR